MKTKRNILKKALETQSDCSHLNIITPTKSVLAGYNGTVEGVKALSVSLEGVRKMLSVGQRFDVYQVDKTDYYLKATWVGFQSIGKISYSSFSGNPLGADLIAPCVTVRLFHSFDPKSSTDTLCHKVGTLVITKVK
jgi:hypothetical protein